MWSILWQGKEQAENPKRVGNKNIYNEKKEITTNHFGTKFKIQRNEYAF